MFGRKRIDTDQKKIDELLTRGVDKITVEESLRKKLVSGRELRIKLGIDPTSPYVHLGHSSQYLKLRDFQKLGHKVVLIFGDATAVIGDTSDKESERPMLTREEVRRNVETYKTQVGKIVDLSKAEVRYNSEWLDKLTFSELGEMASLFSVADFISRDNIKRRLDAGKRVSLRETLYPLMQGYDSVAVKADVELGGSDQWFNILSGRPIQEYFKQEPQDIITNTLYEGLDGRKMSSSWGNTINIDEDPGKMFGKLMSMNDELIISSLVGFTRLPMDTISEIEKKIQTGENPRDAKILFAHEVVRFYHGEKEADKAKKSFEDTFSKGGVPDDIQVIKVSKGANLAEILVSDKIVESKSEVRRLMSSGAITNLDTDEKISDIGSVVNETITLKIGKHRFVKLEE